jgi:hypothetical protein
MVIKSGVFDPCGFHMACALDSRGKQPPDGLFGRVDDGMSLFNRKLAVDFKMKFDEGSVSSVTGAQVMNAADALAGQQCAFDPLAFLVWQLAIKELFKYHGTVRLSARWS